MFLGGEVKEYIFVAIKDIMFVYYLILLLGKFDSRVLVHSPFFSILQDCCKSVESSEICVIKIQLNQFALVCFCLFFFPSNAKVIFKIAENHS